MKCETCGGTHLVQLESYLVCTACGTEKKNNIYVSGYGNPILHKRLQYYSRIKRFRKTVMDLRCNTLGNAMDSILDMYAFLEFMWNNKRDKERKYFFATKIMLYFILKYLEIEKEVPLLKNKDRNEKQLAALEKLLEKNPMFTISW